MVTRAYVDAIMEMPLSEMLRIHPTKEPKMPSNRLQYKEEETIED